jgi:hypothetical protein
MQASELQSMIFDHNLKRESIKYTVAWETREKGICVNKFTFDTICLSMPNPLDL